MSDVWWLMGEPEWFVVSAVGRVGDGPWLFSHSRALRVGRVGVRFSVRALFCGPVSVCRVGLLVGYSSLPCAPLSTVKSYDLRPSTNDLVVDFCVDSIVLRDLTAGSTVVELRVG